MTDEYQKLYNKIYDIANKYCSIVAAMSLKSEILELIMEEKEKSRKFGYRQAEMDDGAYYNCGYDPLSFESLQELYDKK